MEQLLVEDMNMDLNDSPTAKALTSKGWADAALLHSAIEAAELAGLEPKYIRDAKGLLTNIHRV